MGTYLIKITYPFQYNPEDLHQADHQVFIHYADWEPFIDEIIVLLGRGPPGAAPPGGPPGGSPPPRGPPGAIPPRGPPGGMLSHKNILIVIT